MEDNQTIPVEIEELIKKIAKYNKVYGYDKEDLEQEFRMIYFSCLSNFKEEKNVQFKTYFITSCLNKVNRLRKKNKNNPIYLDELNITDNLLDNNYNYELLKNNIVAFLDTIPYGDYGKLYFIYNMKQSDIAALFNVSVIWVNLKIKEIKEKIKDNFS